MAKIAGVFPKPVWLCVLCALALSLSLVAPVLMDATVGSLNSLTSQRSSEGDFPASPSETIDSPDDSAVLTSTGFIYWHPVVIASNVPLPAEWAWSSTPPVRPPNSSISI
jgi:hypothetical protein